MTAPDGRDPRAGIALLAALFAMVVIGVTLAGAWVMVDLDRRATGNREEMTRAALAAEGGLTHALALARGPLRTVGFTRLLIGQDSIPGTADDGVLSGYGLGSGERIPAGGRSDLGATYRVMVVDDPADADGQPLSDSNGRVVVRCVATTTGGASATVEAVMARSTFPAVTVDGPLRITGNPWIRGDCGSIHTNALLDVHSWTRVAGAVSSSGSVSGSANVRDLAGGPLGATAGAPVLPIPALSVTTYCGTADFTLRSDGFLVVNATGALYDARTTAKQGWLLTGTAPAVWTAGGTTITTGTYCVEGNARVTGNPGTAASPASVSLFVQGSVEISGDPYLLARAPGGELVVAGGDVTMAGSAATGYNFQGLVYAGSQCIVAGAPRMLGQLVCKNAANPTNALPWAAGNDISGDLDLESACDGPVGGGRRLVSWYPRLTG